MKLKLSKKSILSFLIVSVLVLSLGLSTFAQTEMYPAKKTALDWVDANEAPITKVIQAIWNYAELGWQEFKSSQALKDWLTENGFKVEGVRGLPTAFVATYGSGEPVIGILGEYDALPMLSQKPGVPQKDPLVKVGEEVGPGHGCGHCMFGAGSTAAAITIAKAMEKHGIRGTVKMFGCPSEEILEGKIYMAAEGTFDGCDTILNWHPGSSNGIGAGSCNALISATFEFYGKTAHSGSAPWAGRSALDAVVLLEVATNFIREHMEEACRIHTVITEGGVQPNVVPDYAKIWIFARAPSTPKVQELMERITNSGKGAALSTDTKMKKTVLTGSWPILPNLTLAQLAWDNLNLIGIPEWTEEEQAFCKEFQKNYGVEQTGMSTTLRPRPTDVSGAGRYSTDVGDVSWISPTGSCAGIATDFPGAAGHTWGIVLGGNYSTGFKGTRKAIQNIAATALDLFTKPELLLKVKKEFEDRRKGIEYYSLLEPDSKPSLDLFTGDMEKFRPLMEQYYTSPK